MSLESVFKLSLVMNMIDNLSGPMAGIASKVGANVSKLDGMGQTLGGIAKAGTAMQAAGTQITGAVLAPVEAAFETRRALGELASLGVTDLDALESAARSFSDQWSGTTKADFISAAYDIKSGISSLSDEGVAKFTGLAALTAKATKATAAEMTSLFAAGYGIYKNYYDDLSDIQFGEMFSAGIAESVRAFKTSGSGMAQSIQSLGGLGHHGQRPAGGAAGNPGDAPGHHGRSGGRYQIQSLPPLGGEGRRGPGPLLPGRQRSAPVHAGDS